MKQKVTILLLILTVAFSTGFWFKKQTQIQTAEAAPQTATTILGGDSFNGNVNSIVVDANIAYLGGTFTSVGKESAYASVISTTTGSFVSGELAINDTVSAIALDGSGGWYIGGSFTSVAGEDRNYLAHIESDGSLDATWNPNADDIIYEIAVSGSDVYVTGDFTTVGGQSRAGFAKLNDTNGNADATWDPDPDDIVNVVAVSGSDVYAGGSFTTIGGQSRVGLAKLNNTNGNADLTWDPDSDDFVTDIAISGSDIYVAGGFTTIGGQSRNYAAKLNNTNGNADATWNPDPDIRAVFIEVSGSDIYIAGHFFSIGGQSRTKIAKLNNTNGNADPAWSAEGEGYDGGIYSLAVSAPDVYFGADFTSIGGQTRTGIVKLNTTNGNVDTAWDAKSSSYQVNDIAVSGTNVYVGGGFESIGGIARNRLASINLTTNTLTDWNPNASGEVKTMLLSGSDLYIGGQFSTVGGESRTNLAKVDIDTGDVDATWNPSADDVVSSLAISGSDIYVAGGFDNVGGLARSAVVKLNSSNGNADASFSMNAYFGGGFGSAETVDILDSYLYIASTNAVTINLVQYRSVYKVNRATGEIDATWPGGCSACGGADAYSAKVISPYIYVSGNFNSYQAGAPSGKLIRLNLDGSIDSTWTPASNQRIYAIAQSGSTVFAGGTFTSIGGQVRNRLAALNSSDGLADSIWDPNIGNRVNTLAVYGSSILVGGTFTGGLKRYDFPTISLSSTNSFVAESIGTANIPLSLSVASDLATTVSYAVTSGNTIGGGVDYTLASGTATIPIGTTSTNISVAIVDDSEAEGPEHLTVTLSNPGGALLGASNVYTLNINDNDHGGGSYPSGGGSSGGGGSAPTVPTLPTSPTLTINNGSLETLSSEVKLQLSAQDQNTKVILSTTPEFTGKPSVGLNQSMSWNLCGGSLPVTNCPDGTYKVYAQFSPSDTTKPLVFVTSEIILRTQAQTTPVPVISQPITSPDIFPRNLDRGNTGPDVFLLQRLLNNFGFTVSPTGFGSPGNETTFFGPRTQRALRSFQKFWLPSITGRFDSLTRELVNSWMR